MNRVAIRGDVVHGDPAMSQQVEDILDQIERLDQADRLLLQERLSDLAEAEWQVEARQARAIALDLGIDQQAIDKAINDVR
jgi:hypothetical protein